MLGTKDSNTVCPSLPPKIQFGIKDIHRLDLKGCKIIHEEAAVTILISSKINTNWLIMTGNFNM